MGEPRIVLIAMPILDPRGGETADDVAIEREVIALIEHIERRARKRPKMGSGIMICALLEAMARFTAGARVFDQAIDPRSGEMSPAFVEAAKQIGKNLAGRIVSCAEGRMPGQFDG